ncbi:MAG: transcriptional regulator [Acidobacteria bacterium]|nr:MAG: transcriptional regulator [Acidobacteriota bacterium]
MAVKSGAFRGSAPIFAALGDGTRLRLVARLCAGGPQSIARLTAGSEITRQAVTKHLLVLADAGLVRGVRKGRESRWALEPEQLEVARRYLDLISEQWTQRLEALERHLESMPETKARAGKRKRSPA